MKCKWNQCNNEARAKSPFCSGTCKKRYSRSETDSPVEVGQKLSGTQVGQCQHPDVLCHACIDASICTYVSGMNTALPGDEDYVGVCNKVDGVMVV